MGIQQEPFEGFKENLKEMFKMRHKGKSKVGKANEWVWGAGGGA